MADAGGSEEFVLWDWPVRLIHWSFVALLPAMWWTAEQDEMGWHFALGAVLFALVLFRILWGFVGSDTALFRQFLSSPRAIWLYLRDKNSARAVVGHNPLGGWSVLAMLALLAAQIGLGLISGDPDDGATGPLNQLVSYSAAMTATDLHELLFNGLLALIALHLLAVAFHVFVKRDNIVRPMLTGRRLDLPAAPIIAGTGRIVICALLAGAAAWWVWLGAPPFAS